jgi:general secretion pathway protein B
MPLPVPTPVYKPKPISIETEPVLPPRWEDLPSEERNRLPAPRIDVHVFAREPARRFVLINLRKYQEGDTVDEGATIESILADGIVLSYQGQRYRVDRP